MYFRDRTDAGQQLAARLEHYRDEAPLVLGLPRGGVPVADEVARALGAPLDVWVVRKVGAPGFPELGLGAVAEGGIVFLNRRLMQEVGVPEELLGGSIRERRAEVEARVARFRRGGPRPALEGRTVILVDDGIATGGTAQAALQALRAAHPRRLVLAVPVAATQSLERLRPLADEVVCVLPRSDLEAIGEWYEDFAQVSDEEVLALLEQARSEGRQPAAHEELAGPQPA